MENKSIDNYDEIQHSMNENFVKYCKRGNIKKVKTILDKGAEISYNNDLPLIYCVAYGNYDVFKYVIEKKTEHDILTECLINTLFIYAINGNYFKIIRYLYNNFNVTVDYDTIHKINKKWARRIDRWNKEKQNKFFNIILKILKTLFIVLLYITLYIIYSFFMLFFFIKFIKKQ